MYLPDVDSFLLIDSLKDYSGESALEIGTGTGIISKFLLRL
jgi:methylase of polypeptide subunit release factors